MADVRIGSEEEMLLLGERLARAGRAGLVLRLIGPLGVGKTTLARGILRGLGYQGAVPSPTYNLIFEYPTAPPVCHADLFRLESPSDAADIGLEDYLQTHFVLIEWAERGGGLVPADSPTVSIRFDNGARRVDSDGIVL